MAPKQPAELSNKEEIHTMQKKLIAAAIAGLVAVPALAQTNVTISGRFAAGWESYKLSDCTAGFSCRSESRVSDQSSRLIFNVNEDLGGGLSAWGQLDYRGALDMGGLGNTGNSGVGLAHKNWGKFTIGRWDVHYGEIEGAIAGNRAGSLQTLLGNGIMSQVSGQVGAAAVWSVVANGTRTPNLLMWDSPNWNGFTARLAYSTNAFGTEGTGRSVAGTGNPGSGRAWTGALRYNNGPWTAGYSYWNANTESGVTGAAMQDQRSHRAWVGYTFAMGLKVGFAWDRSSLDTGVRDCASTTNRRNAWMLPVSYEFGPHKVLPPMFAPGLEQHPDAQHRRERLEPGLRLCLLEAHLGRHLLQQGQQQLRRLLRPFRSGCKRWYRHCSGRRCSPDLHRHGAQLLIDSQSL